jgi:HAD superfamily hydrolase (TIGR01509 family)
MEPLLQRLHSAGVPMHALSNYPVWYELIEEQLQLSRFLAWSFVSCRIGVRKPDPEAYLRSAKTLGVAPNRLVFVDDRQGNCDAAAELGLHAIRFENAEGLTKDLEEIGLLPSGPGAV